MSEENVGLESGQTAAEAEAMVPQSKVNEIVGRAKHEAAEKAIERYKSEQGQANAGMSADAISKLMEERLAAIRQEEEAKRQEALNKEALERQQEEAKAVVEKFAQKVEAGLSDYEDFESHVSGLEMRHYPNVVQLIAEHAEDAAGILYHLSQNRTKLNEIESLGDRNYKDAIYDLKKLDSSLKQNKQGRDSYRKTNAPVISGKNSNLGAITGKLSLSELKQKYTV